MRRIAWYLGAGPLALALGAPSAPAQTFDFEAVPLGTTSPFGTTAGGISATFRNVGAGVPDAFVVIDGDRIGLATLTGHILVDDQPVDEDPARPDQGNDLLITFDRPLSAISMRFALNGDATRTFTLAASLGGAPVGAVTTSGAIPAGFEVPEGTIGFAAGPFDAVRLRTDAISFAVDAIDVRAASTVVPEPRSVVLLALGLPAAAVVARRRRRAPGPSGAKVSSGSGRDS